MKKYLRTVLFAGAFSLIVAATGLTFMALAGMTLAVVASNQLTPEEKKAGWRLLFDGQTTKGWRGFNKKEFPPQGWAVEDGLLHCLGRKGGGAHGGDIVSVDTFSDFDFQFEWRIAPGANSGVKYFISEARKAPIGHEYQLIDDDKNPDAKNGAKRMTAALYDLLPAKDKALRPVGEFNQSRILVRGNHCEHWLNGKKVLQYELGSPELKAAIAASKFKNVPDFGTKVKGPILLQEHGDEIWFRNLKIRELTAE